MNFRFSKSRSLLSRYYNPRALYRHSSRYWDYALPPLWPEMNVGVAQGAVQSFVTTSEDSNPFSSCNPSLGETTTRTLTIRAPSSLPSSSTLNVHWVETPTSHVFKADVPGVRKEDLCILVEGSTLQISGERNLDRVPTDENLQMQREVSFVRRFRLPTTAVMERISAMLDHGVLTLTIPKLQIPPSVAWFVPINSFPPQVTIRNLNQQEQSQPDSHDGLDHRLNTTMVVGRSRIIESRAQESNLPSSASIQSVSSKGRDNKLTPDCDINVSSTDPKVASKTLNVMQEEGTGSNACVTLNININTGKRSPEGASSSGQVTPTSQMGDQKHLLGGLSKPSSQSRSISPPLTLRPRPSLAQTPKYEDEEVEPPPSTSRRRPSIQIEDDPEVGPPPSVSRRKPSILIEDDPEVEPPPSASRRKPSIQIEDDPEVEPPPSVSRRKPSIQIEDDPEVEPSPSSRRKPSIQIEDGPEFGPSPSTRRKSAIQVKDDQDDDPSPSSRWKPSTQIEDDPEVEPSPSTRRKSSIQVKDNQADDPSPSSRHKSSLQVKDDQADDPSPSSRRKSSLQVKDDQADDPSPSSRRKSSIQVKDDQADDPSPSSRRKSSLQMEGNQDEDLNPPLSSKRKSLAQAKELEAADFAPRPSMVKRKPLIQVDEQGEDDDDPSSSSLPRQGSVAQKVNNLKRPSLGSQKIARQLSEVEDEKEASTSNMEGPIINKRRQSRRGSSQVVQRQPSTDGADEEENTSDVEDGARERQRSKKRGSRIVERSPSIDEDDDPDDDEGFNKRQRARTSRSDSEDQKESVRKSSLGSVRRKSSFGKRGSIAEAENNEFRRKPSTQGGRREPTKRQFRNRESTLGLGAALPNTAIFGARDDEEEA